MPRARNLVRRDAAFRLLAIDTRRPQKGRELRIGLYRIAGVDPSRRFYAWRPTGQTSFHVARGVRYAAAEIDGQVVAGS
jgi:hypothetical protein